MDNLDNTYVLPEPPEFYEVCPIFNSDGRLCNYSTEGTEFVKVHKDEIERFNELAGRQHKIVDGWVEFDEALEPCMPDEAIMSPSTDE